MDTSRSDTQSVSSKTSGKIVWLSPVLVLNYLPREISTSDTIVSLFTWNIEAREEHYYESEWQFEDID